jgi:hypothetical protein
MLLRNILLRNVLRLLVTANVPSSPILVTLTLEAVRSSETSAFTRATRLIPEDGILQIKRFPVRCKIQPVLKRLQHVSNCYGSHVH